MRTIIRMVNRVVLITAVCLFALGMLWLSTTVATAQSGNNSSVVDSVEDEVIEQVESRNSGEPNPEEYKIAINSDVRVIDYSYNSQGLLSVEIEADRRVSIVFTDGSKSIDGAVDIKRETKTVPEGVSTVKFQIENPDRKVVTLGAGDDLIGLGSRGFNLFSGPASWQFVRVGAISGLLGGLLPVGYVAVKKRREAEEEVERVV